MIELKHVVVCMNTEGSKQTQKLQGNSCMFERLDTCVINVISIIELCDK